jgi:anti-sigma B factor antagonist
MLSSLALPSLSVSVIPDRDRVRVLAVGELDLSTAELLDAQLDELFAVGWSEVTVDLREVEFMDSSGVHVLLRARQGADGTPGRLEVVVDPGPVQELLRLTGADGPLGLVADGG